MMVKEWNMQVMHLLLKVTDANKSYDDFVPLHTKDLVWMVLKKGLLCKGPISPWNLIKREYVIFDSVASKKMTEYSEARRKINMYDSVIIELGIIQEFGRMDTVLYSHKNQLENFQVYFFNLFRLMHIVEDPDLLFKDHEFVQEFGRNIT